MKNVFKLKAIRRIAEIIALVAIIGFSMVACNKGKSDGSVNAQSGKTINSAEELRTYLDSQPVNGPDNPIRVSMVINNPMIESVANVIITSPNKYVSLNITGNALTTIPEFAFADCNSLVSITMPNSVTIIEDGAFYGCPSLISITIGNSATKIGLLPFYGDLEEKYLAGGIGMYTTTAPVNMDSKWTKQ